VAKIKLDLHPIFSNGGAIEAELARVLREAEEKHIPEIEIIPGKGSGALKKTVLRFLERPENRVRYHRSGKDGDNWGRWFVYFRFGEPAPGLARPTPTASVDYACYFCRAANPIGVDAADQESVVLECPACGLPNRVRISGPEGHRRITCR
jgi:DNA-directed RNA polymerase subunit RPC12/RpoP